MNVKTNLHSGGLFEDAGARVDTAINSASIFVVKAKHQAKDVTSNIVNTTTNVWNSIRTTFSF